VAGGGCERCIDLANGALHGTGGEHAHLIRPRWKSREPNQNSCGRAQPTGVHGNNLARARRRPQEADYDAGLVSRFRSPPHLAASIPGGEF
jgi:hypothetical protein